MNPTDILGAAVKTLECLLDIATNSGAAAAATALEHAIASLVVERAAVDATHAATDAELERRRKAEGGA